MSDPIFTSDLSGYVRLFLAVVASGSAMGGLLGFWLKRRDDARWAQHKAMLDGVGRRIDQVSQEQGIHAGWFNNAREQQVRIDGKVTGLGERVARVETGMERVDRDVNEHHSDLRELIEKSNREMLEAVHSVQIEVARLQEKNNIGEHLSELGKSIERAIRVAVHREPPR